jgi:diadenylate cyclase
LDPLLGHSESTRHVNNLDLRGTIKELAQLDGGFVVVTTEFSFRRAATSTPWQRKCQCRWDLAAVTFAAANMSAVTKAVGIVLSESLVVRLFCHGQLVGEIIPELWMMDHAQLRYSVEREQVGELTVFTPKRPASIAK